MITFLLPLLLPVLLAQNVIAQQQYAKAKGVLPFKPVKSAVFDRDDFYPVLLTDKYSGSPLTGATVISVNSELFLISDSLGRIILPSAIIEMEESLQISMTGYKNVTVNARQLIDRKAIEMEPDRIMLEGVVISNNSAVAKVNDIQMGLEIITAAEARKLPAILGEVDIIKILQLKPGVKSAGEGLAGFYVRGGGADQNLIQLDGVPVYNPNHLLGLFSVFNNDAVRDLKLYKSAYPAGYGGRLSSVLDVTSRSGSMDSLIVSGGIGILSSRLSVEAPIKKGLSSFIVSGRRTYFDIFTRALNRMQEDKEDYEPVPAYSFSDINLRSDWKINRKNSMWATAYWGSDNFNSAAENLSMAFIWGNKTASVNWKSVVKNKMEIISSIFYSGYQYQLSNQSGYNDMKVRSGINTIGAKVIATTVKTNAFTWQGGVEGMIHKLNIGDYKSSSNLNGFTAGETASGNEAGIFLNTEWDEGKRVAWQAGLRLSGFESGGRWKVHPEPRLAARMNVGEHAAFKASYTRMYQYLHLASLSTASMPVDIWYPSTNRTLPQSADQLSISWSRTLNNDMLYFSLEGYYKWMNNQVEFKDGANIFGNPKLENDFVYGKGNAYGVEAYLEKKIGRTTGWLGYTLSWATRTFADINGGTPFKPRYDRRHDLAFVFMHKINKKFSVSGNWIYGSGAYTTVPVGRYVFQDHAGSRIRSIIPVYTQRGNYQFEAVHRLDLSLTMALKSGRGEKEIIFSLYNAYSRRNPFYIQFKEVELKEGYITAIEPTLVSLFPILPGITWHFKF